MMSIDPETERMLVDAVEFDAQIEARALLENTEPAW